MDVEALYEGLKKIQDRGEIGNAYSGCGSVDSEMDVLTDFYDYIVEKYEASMPAWAEAFIQIFSWQFQTLHEYSQTYYENEYGGSDYKTILRVAGYLRENGYHEIEKPYAAAAVDCGHQYPDEMIPLLPDNWIDENDETIWNFYVDILEKHREELLGDI